MISVKFSEILVQKFQELYHLYLLFELMAQPDLPIRIIAQPRAEYRERYVSEMMRSRNRAHRYIRADTNPKGLDYPTIEVKDI